ncbi:MAG: activase, partial [Desulfobacterales bacterium CG23_combo_of_CG06-09_8_20_14_all_51_8]
MNEACSAGTGSFLAEAAHETLGIPVENIAEVALLAENPPNFNDQCAAFISSDIKTAIHEGIDPSDIVAGLVYSICMNYNNRVKGNRPVGRKIFMQGGVCYNRAVPLAMAALTGRKIIVPPEPGLMGAFGAALEIKKRTELGLIRENQFDLKALSERSVGYGKSFTCRGGRERCDRGCAISIIELEGKKFPFGGACNRYYNLRHQLTYDVESLDLVRAREKLIFPPQVQASLSGIPQAPPAKPRKTIGINKSFLVNSFYPFYEALFLEMGFAPVLAKTLSKPGIDRKNAAFCYPAELAHGFFHGLIQRDNPLDYIFLPHIHSIPVEKRTADPQTCPFVQGEPYYLQAAFGPEIERLKNQGTRILSPFVNMPGSLADAREAMMQTAEQMGIVRKSAMAAFDRAMRVQQQCFDKMKSMGQGVLEDLAANPEKIAIVVFGRPYNAMVEEAHMGIPHKFASRGVTVVPFDFLPFEQEDAKQNMYWGMGQLILKAARLVQKHPQLYGAYITNFSCGPDSFLITYFRAIMGRKPSLTLELDSHTADAGLETRIEAFLDIVRQYRQIMFSEKPAVLKKTFTPARTFLKRQTPYVRTSAGVDLPVTDPRVTLLIPSMGRISTQAIAAVFADAGYHVAPLLPTDDAVLKLGRAHTSCKECLPLILTTGTLLDYAYHQKKIGEVLVYFMPSASGPCRFGQYAVFMEDLICRLGLSDVAVFSLTSDNTYSTMGKGFNNRKAWCAIVLGDLMEDAHAMLLANALDSVFAEDVFNAALASLLKALLRGGFDDLRRELGYQIGQLSAIPVKRPYKEVPKILLTGEIFVRRDAFSRQQLGEHLAKMGFAVACSP